MHGWWGARSSAKAITRMVPVAMFKSVFSIPDLIAPGGRELETGQHRMKETQFEFAQTFLMIRAQTGQRMDGAGSNHMKQCRVPHSRERSH